MKTNPFVFDMRLHSIIRENQVDRFTTKQLRDAYAQCIFRPIVTAHSV